jgi:hypothetical protein
MEIATTITVLFVLTSFTYNSIPPAKSATPTEIGWQLTVTGLVEKPLNLNWIEIVAMTRSSVEANLICVDFPGQIVMQGNWTGVKLRTLLEEAKPLPSAIKVGFYAADGYSTDLTAGTAMRDDIILAYEKDGFPPDDLKSSLPDPISTPPTTTAPSQSPSQPPTTYPTPLDTSTPTPAPSENMYISTETVYTIAVSLVAVVSVVGLMFVRKRKTTEKN